MSRFNSVKVFSATMLAHRAALGEQVTAWIETTKARHPDFKIVDMVVTQSSDAAFHCLAITVFYAAGDPHKPRTIDVSKEAVRRG